MKIKRMIALVIALIIAGNSMAIYASAELTEVSDYIGYSYAEIRNKNGNIEIWFTIDSADGGNLTEIGVLTITLQEYVSGKWNTVKTFTKSAYPQLMGSNTYSHDESVIYEPKENTRYQAIVTFWAARNGVGDSAIYTTSSYTTPSKH